jgi:gamma-glutamyltranspeptidase/glutathione hydrolase
MPLNAKAVYARADADLAPFASRRSTVHSRNGIISCTQPLAAAAGQRILSQGGNAADAAVAVGMTQDTPHLSIEKRANYVRR